MLKDWRQEGKGTIENEMVGWHYRLTQWTWVWAKSGRRWRTGSPGVLQSMGSQRFGLSDWTIPVSSLYWRTDAFRLRVFSLNAYLLGNVLLFLFFFFSDFSGGTEPIWPCRKHKRNGFDPWVGKITWRRHGSPLQYSCWRIPQTEESGRLQSTGLQRAGHDWSDLAQ